jgi:hypothetical protein
VIIRDHFPISFYVIYLAAEAAALRNVIDREDGPPAIGLGGAVAVGFRSEGHGVSPSGAVPSPVINCLILSGPRGASDSQSS